MVQDRMTPVAEDATEREMRETAQHLNPAIANIECGVIMNAEAEMWALEIYYRCKRYVEAFKEAE